MKEDTIAVEVYEVREEFPAARKYGIVGKLLYREGSEMQMLKGNKFALRDVKYTVVRAKAMQLYGCWVQLVFAKRDGALTRLEEYEAEEEAELAAR